MALVKISQLPATATLSRAQEIPTNNAGVNEKITISQIIDANPYSISADYNGSLTDAYTHIYFNHSSSTKLIQYNCPNCASSDGRLIILQNLATGLSYVNGNGANIEFKGNSLSTIKLFSAGDKIGIRSDGSNWQVEFCYISIITEWMNRSDWTNVQVGSAFTYDNKSAAVDLTGQKVTLDSGNTCVVAYDSGGTGASGTLYVYGWTGTGIAANNEEGICGSGGYTFDVDEGTGSSKNVNYSYYPNLGLNIIYFEKELYVNSSASYTGCHDIRITNSVVGQQAGFSMHQTDINQIEIIGALQYFAVYEPSGGGAMVGLAAQDYYLNIIFSVSF